MTSAHPDGEGLRARWTESERRLYPLATTSPEKYEALVRIARRIADDLAPVASRAELSREWEEHDERARAAASAAGVPLGDLPVTDVAGVGFALRDAELRGREQQQQQQTLLEDARANGDEWVTLHEHGRLDGGLMDAYQAIEMHLATGIAIVSSVEPHPATAQANYVLSVVRMDPATGAVTDVDPGIADVQEFDHAEAFGVARDRLAAIIAAR